MKRKILISGLAVLLLVICAGAYVLIHAHHKSYLAAKRIELNTLNDEGTALRKQGEYDRAVELAKKALRVAEKSLNPDDPYMAMSLNSLGMGYSAQGKYAQAEPLYKRALAIYEKSLGQEHPYLAICLNNLAGIYRAQCKYDQAGPLYKRALARASSKRSS